MRSLLACRSVLLDEFRSLDRQAIAMARSEVRTRQLMTIPGVGALTSLTFVAAIDQVDRFRSSRRVGAHFGLTPRKYQSGETDYSGRISKCGDVAVRTALFEAANVMMMRTTKASDLKTWACSLAKRSGMKKAKVALARKLGVVMHAMLRDGTAFIARKESALPSTI